MITIYYIEDDENISRMVKDFLDMQGYRVRTFAAIVEAEQAIRETCPSLVLIDWNLPDGNGNRLCQQIRSNYKELPIIFLTVRGDSKDIVSGFQSGADDYVVKPFDLEVLLSRIRALLRRTGNVSQQYLSCGLISLDKEQRQVFCHGEKVVLTPSEYGLLLCLLQNKGRIITRETLLQELWDKNGNYVNDNTLTVTMKRLREKLHQPACLKTVRCIGYRMEEA